MTITSYYTTMDTIQTHHSSRQVAECWNLHKQALDDYWDGNISLKDFVNLSNKIMTIKTMADANC